MTAFSTVNLPAPIAKAIEALGFADMTPVQAQALPVLLKGNDVVVQARTGSGKTLAFAAPALARIELRDDVVQTLVLCPTRELADQVGNEFRRLGRFLPNLRVVVLTGGVPVRTQLPAMQRPPHVVVGTPGRIGDHLGRGSLDLSQVRTVVLDEADRMLDMGFYEA
ncbi:MAG TPA: DEAD/DEAH box helicase, partial [Myxococcota bacterium]